MAFLKKYQSAADGTLGRHSLSPEASGRLSPGNVSVSESQWSDATSMAEVAERAASQAATQAAAMMQEHITVKEAELAAAWASFSEGAEEMLSQIEQQGSTVARYEAVAVKLAATADQAEQRAATLQAALERTEKATAEAEERAADEASKTAAAQAEVNDSLSRQRTIVILQRGCIVEVMGVFRLRRWTGSSTKLKCGWRPHSSSSNSQPASSQPASRAGRPIRRSTGRL